MNGLVRLRDSQIIVPPSAQSYGSSTVYVGATAGGDGSFTGTPMADVAFDPGNEMILYVAPVIVSVPAQGSIPAHSYRAAAKLQRTSPGAYNLVQLYGVDPYYDPNVTTMPPDASPYSIQWVREIEVDRTGQNLYVTCCHALNDNEWLLVYSTATGVGQRISLTSLSPSLKSVESLLASAMQDKLYLTSAANLGADSAMYRLTINGPSVALDGVITIHNPLPTTPCAFCTGSVSTILAVAENPADGGIYAIGFTAPRIPEDLPRFIGQADNPQYMQFFSNSASIFTTPTLAVIPAGSAGPVTAVAISGSNMALPLSAVFIPTAADFNHDGHVDASDLTLFKNCTTRSGVPYNPNALPNGCTLTPDAQGKIPADFDKDGDVDMSDFGKLQRCYGGANVLPALDCAD